MTSGRHGLKSTRSATSFVEEFRASRRLARSSSWPTESKAFATFRRSTTGAAREATSRKVRRVLRAPPAAFHPPPEVTSAVVELLPLHPPRAEETESFRTLVRRAFGARRKTLRNAWAGIATDSAALHQAASSAGITLDARGETLDVEAFARMASALQAVTARA